VTAAADRLILHASCVAAHGRAVLITGPSGSGKSSLAMQMLALGARLISDDQTEVVATAKRLIARCPSPAIAGLIEARGVGLLRAEALAEAPVALVVDLSQEEDSRLPPRRMITVLGTALPLVLQARNSHFPSALMIYLQGGRQE
jgi:HPr kinase/phosphorylase